LPALHDEGGVPLVRDALLLLYLEEKIHRVRAICPEHVFGFPRALLLRAWGVGFARRNEEWATRRAWGKLLKVSEREEIVTTEDASLSAVPKEKSFRTVGRIVERSGETAQQVI
jgi:hypothetical protein